MPCDRVFLECAVLYRRGIRFRLLARFMLPVSVVECGVRFGRSFLRLNKRDHHRTREGRCGGRSFRGLLFGAFTAVRGDPVPRVDGVDANIFEAGLYFWSFFRVERSRSWAYHVVVMRPLVSEDGFAAS